MLVDIPISIPDHLFSSSALLAQLSSPPTALSWGSDFGDWRQVVWPQLLLTCPSSCPTATRIEPSREKDRDTCLLLFHFFTSCFYGPIPVGCCVSAWSWLACWLPMRCWLEFSGWSHLRLLPQHSHLTWCSGAVNQFSRAAMTKYCRLGDLNSRNFSVSILGARCLGSKSQQGWFLGLWLHHLNDFHLHCPHDILPVCMYSNVHISPFRRTLVILD